MIRTRYVSRCRINSLCIDTQGAIKSKGLIYVLSEYKKKLWSGWKDNSSEIQWFSMKHRQQWKEESTALWVTSPQTGLNSLHCTCWHFKNRRNPTDYPWRVVLWCKEHQLETHRQMCSSLSYSGINFLWLRVHLVSCLLHAKWTPSLLEGVTVF